MMVNRFFRRSKLSRISGGEMAWRKFLEKKLNPNVPVDNGAPAGIYKVYVQFVVNKEGI